MLPFQRTLKFIEYSRLYLAIGAPLFLWALSAVLRTTFPLPTGISVGLTIFAAYAINKKSDIEEDSINLDYGSPRLAHILFRTGIISLLGAYILSFLHNPALAIPITLFMALLFLYTVDILPASMHYQRLKQIPFVKNLTIALAWSILLIGSIRPLFSFDTATAIIFTFVFLRIFIGSVIPDIRDIKGDQAAGVDTIPVLYGIQTTKLILLFTNLGVTLLFYGSIFLGHLPREAIIPGFININSFFLLLSTTQDTADKLTLATEINDLYVFPLLLLLVGAI
jgi:4-hydroxybenzoate polyprenyltransferase